jgi:MFS family permease
MNPATTMPHQAVTSHDPRRWAAFAVLLVGAFLPPLDFFIVNVALPSIRQGLGATPAEVQFRAMRAPMQCF